MRPVPVGIRGRRITGHEAHIRDNLAAQRGVRGDARVDDRDANALAGYARDRTDAEQPLRAGARLVGAVDLFDTVIAVRTRASPER